MMVWKNRLKTNMMVSLSLFSHHAPWNSASWVLVLVWTFEQRMMGNLFIVCPGAWALHHGNYSRCSPWSSVSWELSSCAPQNSAVISSCTIKQCKNGKFVDTVHCGIKNSERLSYCAPWKVLNGKYFIVQHKTMHGGRFSQCASSLCAPVGGFLIVPP